jgi:hypothetical protein
MFCNVRLSAFCISRSGKPDSLEEDETAEFLSQNGWRLTDYSETEDYTTTIVAAPIGYNATNAGATMKNDGELTSTFFA